MVEDEAVRDLGKGAEPVEQAIGQRWRAFPQRMISLTVWLKIARKHLLRTEAPQKGSRLIVALELASQKKKQGHEGKGEQESRDEGGKES